jgi:hypothetical protein
VAPAFESPPDRLAVLQGLWINRHLSAAAAGGAHRCARMTRQPFLSFAADVMLVAALWCSRVPVIREFANS